MKTTKTFHLEVFIFDGKILIIFEYACSRNDKQIWRRTMFTSKMICFQKQLQVGQDSKELRWPNT